MLFMAEAEIGPGFVTRRAPRHRSATRAELSQLRQPPEPIAIVDISTHGCGFESRWPFEIGMRVWLRLPGLEKWGATVAWYGDGKGGLEFAQPLHPLVAARFVRGV